MKRRTPDDNPHPPSLQELMQQTSGVDLSQIKIKAPLSDYICPECGTRAERFIEPVPTFNGQVRPHVTDRPVAVRVILPSEDDPAIELQTQHCLPCYLRWQALKASQDVKDNVPELVLQPEDVSDDAPDVR